MADGYLNFDTKINTKGFSSGVVNIEKGLNSLKSKLSSIASAVGVAFSVTTVKKFSRACESAYNVQIEQETKLAAVMQQRMQSSSAEIQSVKDLASAQQELGIIGDEVQLAGAQQIATFLDESESLKSLIPAMNNLLAQQKGINATTSDAVSIGNMFGKVMQGQTSALTRVGITFSDAEEQVLKYGNETERAAMLAKVITNNVGEMNSVLAQTDMGRQKQLSNTLGDIQEQFGNAVQQIEILFIPALSRLAAFLSTVASQAQKAAQAIAVVFGAKSSGSGVSASGAVSSDTDLSDTTAETADTSGKAAENYENIADSAERAEEAGKGSLAAFDELNVLSQNDNQTAVSFTVDDTDSELESKLADLGESFSLSVGLDTSDLETSFDGFVEALRQKWESLKALCEPLRESFENLKTTLRGVGEFAGENLTNFYEHFLKPLGEWTLGEGLPRFIEITDKTLQNIDFESLNESCDNLYQALEPFAENVGEGLLWFYDNVLSPFISWSIGEALPAFLDTLSGAIEVLNGIIEADKDLMQWLWDEFLSPFAEWTGGTVVSILESISDGLHSLSDWISEHQETVQNFTVIVGTLGGALGIAWIINSAVAAFTALGGVMGICSAVGSVLGGVMAFLTSPITLVALAIAGLIAIGIMLYKNWDEIKEFGLMCWDTIKQSLSTAWENIKNVFSKVGDFFGNVWKAVKKPFVGIADWFRGKFQTAWEAVKKVFSKGGEVFSGIKDGILDSLKSIINGLIDGINTVVSIPFSGINSALDGIRGIEIAGHSPFGWLPTINIPEIPKLATGTVVPANYGEFAAILGDNKREAEIVSPLSTIKQAMIEALTEADIRGSQSNGDIVINIDGREIMRVVQKQNNSYKRTHGGRSAFA